jgi:hypothetical protein
MPVIFQKATYNVQSASVIFGQFRPVAASVADSDYLIIPEVAAASRLQSVPEVWIGSELTTSSAGLAGKFHVRRGRIRAIFGSERS